GLIDQVGSPTGALDMISGAYLVGQTAPSIEVRGGAGVGFSPVTVLPKGDYARIIGQDGIWKQIICPPAAAPWDGECWVPEEPFTAVYNDDPLDESPIPSPAQAKAAPPAIEPMVTTPPVAVDPESLCISIDTGVIGEIRICPEP
ncbi:MAG: hypothetical protein R3293_11095, partial [Candidatus Promineifilaceae bacterium]|nr:hypothetical protein [Candidatus Promineifilaceae bacterium]